MNTPSQYPKHEEFIRSSILTKRDLLLVLANVPDDAWIHVMDNSTNLVHPRAELNIIPPFPEDDTGLSKPQPSKETVRAILVPNDYVGPAWPAGTTVVLRHPFDR